MATNAPHDAKPGKDTPKKVAVECMSTTTTIKFFEAQNLDNRAWLARAVSGFYLYRGKEMDALVMLVLAAVYVIWGAR